MTTINEMLAALPAYDELIIGINGAPPCRMMARDLPCRRLDEYGGQRRFTNLDCGTEFFVTAATQIDSVIAPEPVTAAVWSG